MQVLSKSLKSSVKKSRNERVGGDQKFLISGAKQFDRRPEFFFRIWKFRFRSSSGFSRLSCQEKKYDCLNVWTGAPLGTFIASPGTEWSIFRELKTYSESNKVAKSNNVANFRKQSITFTANVSEFCSITHFCRKLAQEYICGQNSSFVWGTFSKKLTIYLIKITIYT